MDILLVGSGGREHALAWKIRQSPLVERIYCAPGNPGIAKVAECLPGYKANDAEGLARLARELGVGLVVVGPEVALEAGLADRLNAAGIPCFGPTARAAQLETSKAFSKAFMARHEIPTAHYGVYERIKDARAALMSSRPTAWRPERAWPSARIAMTPRPRSSACWAVGSARPGPAW
jgi:phosphoribosylamine--glycine ligase